MTRLRRLCWSALIAGLLTIALAAPAFAGGWAIITLDQVPTDVSAGQAFSLGFMVRQHGVTPIDGAYGGATMVPVLTARNSVTGATLRAEARKEGPVGHFVVDVTFPAEGSWTWEIAPPPFAATDLGTLTVLPAGAPPTGVNAPATPAAAPWFVPDTLRDGLRWGAVMLLVAALGVGLWSQRAAIVRWRALRAR
jgi:hypothetical protein